MGYEWSGRIINQATSALLGTDAFVCILPCPPLLPSCAFPSLEGLHTSHWCSHWTQGSIEELLTYAFHPSMTWLWRCEIRCRAGAPASEARTPYISFSRSEPKAGWTWSVTGQTLRKLCHPDFWLPEPLEIKMWPLLPQRKNRAMKALNLPCQWARDSNFFFKGEFCTIPTHFCFKPKSKILTLNCEGVSRMLKSEDAEIPSSRVSRNTFWNSSISGKLPKSDSIYMKAGIGKRVSAVKTQRPL